MKLSRLELFGFKSFLNRTVFQFGEGITSVVGPNGCGKSNLADAIAWVLGERGTKSLRVKEMGDVIFQGSNGKRPVNIAEVALELIDGTNDFVVKRRIYRDGTNEYFLNGKLVRLKDVQDTFLGTGLGTNSYAIIEQGRIESFITMKPPERRIVIEEASGITRFEEKKRDAISRMGGVTSNLERVEDIYREVTLSFGKAEQEWERWKVYRELADRLHEIEKQLLLDGYGKLQRRMTKIRERQAGLEEEALQKETERDNIKEEFEAKGSEFALTDNIIRQLEIDIKSKEKDMENRLLEIEYINEEKRRFEDGLNETNEQDVVLTRRIGQCHGEVEALEKKAAALTAELREEEEREVETKRVAEVIKTNIEEREKEIEDSRTKLFVAMSSLTDVRNRMAEIERLEKEKQKSIERQAVERAEIGALMSQLDDRERILENSLEEALEEKGLFSARESALSAERELLARTMDELKRLVEGLRSEKRVKEDFLVQLGGYIESDAELTRSTEDRLFNLIKVDETKVKALEKFFSEELEYDVIREASIEALIEATKFREGNRIFFSPKGIFRKNGDDVEIDITWVDDIEDALRRVVSGKEGIFMNEDIYIDSRGIMLSGTGSKKIDVKQFREKLKLEKELHTISADIERHLLSINETRSKIERYDSEHRVIEAERERWEEKARSIKNDLVLVDARRKTAIERIAALEVFVEFPSDTDRREMSSLIEERDDREKEKADIEALMATLKGELATVRKEHEEAQSLWHEVTIDIERKSNILRAVQDERERASTAILGFAGEIGKLKEDAAQKTREIKERSEKISTLERSYNYLQEETQKYLAKYEELKVMLGTLHGERQELQESMETASKEIERIRNRRENTEKEIAVLEEKRVTVLDHLRNTYGIDDPAGLALQASADIEEERRELTDRIAEMGEINFRAEKEYLELKERIAFLERQKEDLRGAMDSLKRTIAKIDDLTKELFSETFDKVNEAFKRFTDMLFKGGKGYLAVNTEQGGIDMFVQPPGKKVTRMELLSGGEKALISLAFLLALMDTKPSPFALMDEIDAPLDDANLTGLLEIIRSMSLKSQIIFITHNRITMEYSDTIYGVTMEEEGVSKMVSVRL